ncbi:MAG: twin-arginine translocase subunit TatC, partial [Acidobacteriaceae bacterium]|nr:twin-arginine translocase subunit TatC [Acidobacteriaceae bacterium]
MAEELNGKYTVDPLTLYSEDGPQPHSAPAYSSSSHPYEPETRVLDTAVTAVQTAPPPPPPSPPSTEDESDDEEEGMLRMSFMEHLEELRTRLLRAIIGIVVAFLVSIGFCKDLWKFVTAPAKTALQHLGINPPNLAAIKPMEQFNIIYLKLPLLVSIFLASPWVLYQVWAFISPGLYRREKRWAVPFILCTAGLFITGGCFAYFVAFRFGLE